MYKRILLKLSGESLQGTDGRSICEQHLVEYADQIIEASRLGVQIGIVIGGGFDRVGGDQMGMLATVINSLALQSAIESGGGRCRVLTAIRMEPIAEFYSKRKAIESLERGEIVIFSAGTGSPYFTTDTGASLRAVEIEADVMLKGTRVDGVYDSDPEKNPNAVRFETISFDEVYARNLRVMDRTATAMCAENNLPIIVFDMDTQGNLRRLLCGEKIGTIVTDNPQPKR